MLELVGSPKQIAIQPPGVLYALNCGGPSYHAMNDIVYMSELRQYANFSYDFTYGKTIIYLIYLMVVVQRSKNTVPCKILGNLCFFRG